MAKTHKSNAGKAGAGDGAKALPRADAVKGGKTHAGGQHASAHGPKAAAGAKGSSGHATAGGKAVAKGGPGKARSAATGMSGIDTAGAASAAARMLAAGLGKRAKGGAAGPESALFKQIKSGASPTTDKHLSNFLDRTTPAGTKRLDQSVGGGPVQGHNQTVGTDAQRINVPRRTGG